MNFKEMLNIARENRKAYKKRGEPKTLEYCLLNLIFERYYEIEDNAKNALLQEMASMILDFRSNLNYNVAYLEDNIAEWHTDLLEEENI